MKVHRPPAARKIRVEAVVCAFLFCICLWCFCWPSGERHGIRSQAVQLAAQAASEKEEEAPMLRLVSDGDSINNKYLGAVVFLAPARDEVTWWASISRFCFLMRAVRSVDQNVNQHYGPYPIFILLARDYELSDNPKDGAYTERDRALIQAWAPNSQVIFKEVNLYSGDALEPGTTVEQIKRWRKGEDGAVEGRSLGYQSMCRLWSGRLQAMDFLQDYKYYMRMDDDSLLTDTIPFDPFKEMESNGLDYVWRRDSVEGWGVEKLKELIDKHITITSTTPYISKGIYRGGEPYNNFHISRVSFWSEPRWLALWKDLNDEHAFFKHRLGDANVHAVAIMMLSRQRIKKWRHFPYVHNSNDMANWGQTSWRLECEAAEQSVQAEATPR